MMVKYWKLTIHENKKFEKFEKVLKIVNLKKIICHIEKEGK